LEQPLQREFYAEMCRIERWSVRTLMERGLSSPQVEVGSKA
jgi:predicted nuclease of restriction endonuclease-like (RecB) superfamily